MANRRTLEEQIEQAQKELKQKEAKIKDLMQRQRSKADRARNHRLCKRGGLVESLLPGLVRLTDEQFDTWTDKVLLSGYAQEVIDQLSPPESDETESGALPAQEETTAEPEVTDVPEETSEPAVTEAPKQPPDPPAAEPANVPDYERINNNPQRSSNANHNGNSYTPKQYNLHHNNRSGNRSNANHNISRNH